MRDPVHSNASLSSWILCLKQIDTSGRAPCAFVPCHSERDLKPSGGSCLHATVLAISHGWESPGVPSGGLCHPAVCARVLGRTRHCVGQRQVHASTGVSPMAVPVGEPGMSGTSSARPPASLGMTGKVEMTGEERGRYMPESVGMP